MLRTIELDDESHREADEVNDIRSNRGLATEFVAAQFLGAKEVPQTFFGIGGLIAQPACEVALQPSLLIKQIATSSPAVNLSNGRTSLR